MTQNLLRHPDGKDWINYHHLKYFWTIAREGGVTPASRILNLTQPTLSGQLAQLEESLGEKLFTRSGRKLVLTDTGKIVFQYADDIFSLGREMMDAMKDRPTGRPLRFEVGVEDVITKAAAFHLLQPALSIPQRIHLICREDRAERLMADLAVHSLDLILLDSPRSPHLHVQSYQHLLMDSGITFFASPELARSLSFKYPRSLHGAPFLLPASSTELRRDLDQWFNSRKIIPQVVGEFEDSSLMKVFGEGGRGVFVGTSHAEDEICRKYKVQILGRTREVRERIYAISVDRKLEHPAVKAVTESARRTLKRQKKLI